MGSDIIGRACGTQLVAHQQQLGAHCCADVGGPDKGVAMLLRNLMREDGWKNSRLHFQNEPWIDECLRRERLEHEITKQWGHCEIRSVQSKMKPESDVEAVSRRVRLSLASRTMGPSSRPSRVPRGVVLQVFCRKC
eukprot:4492341-Amphidinium_carterae.1